MVKVFNDWGFAHDDQIIDGIEWAIAQGAQIISLSFARRRMAGEAFITLYETAATNANSNGAGVLFVTAAGNNSIRPSLVAPVCNPAACPSFLAVAAVDYYEEIADFSCARVDAIGEVNVCAPGVSVYSSGRDGGFLRMSGTSMAAPHVAGVAALHLQLNPGMKWRDLWAILVNTARGIGLSAENGGSGIVQAP